MAQNKHTWGAALTLMSGPRIANRPIVARIRREKRDDVEIAMTSTVFKGLKV
jgi:hypothetical protein